MELVEYLESTFNHKKLRNSRKRRNLSIAEVSEKTGIPAATLQKYESGIIKKIPLETLKKISDVYGTDYGSYYGWTCFPLYGTFSGLAFASAIISSTVLYFESFSTTTTVGSTFTSETSSKF